MYPTLSVHHCWTELFAWPCFTDRECIELPRQLIKLSRWEKLTYRSDNRLTERENHLPTKENGSILKYCAFLRSSLLLHRTKVASRDAKYRDIIKRVTNTKRRNMRPNWKNHASSRFLSFLFFSLFLFFFMLKTRKENLEDFENLITLIDKIITIPRKIRIRVYSYFRSLCRNTTQYTTHSVFHSYRYYSVFVSKRSIVNSLGNSDVPRSRLRIVI